MLLLLLQSETLISIKIEKGRKCECSFVKSDIPINKSKKHIKFVITNLSLQNYLNVFFVESYWFLSDKHWFFLFSAFFYSCSIHQNADIMLNAAQWQHKFDTRRTKKKKDKNHRPLWLNLRFFPSRMLLFFLRLPSIIFGSS